MFNAKATTLPPLAMLANETQCLRYPILFCLILLLWGDVTIPYNRIYQHQQLRETYITQDSDKTMTYTEKDALLLLLFGLFFMELNGMELFYLG